MADFTDRDFRPVRNVDQNRYLGEIGARLLAVLPPPTIQFHYTLVESSEVNGFSIAGGRIYLTRKLVASAHSEDEIAGVIAHEMGHIVTHQSAIETTADMKRLLGVTSVGDRADVYTKFQRLVDAYEHEKHLPKGGDTGEKQEVADRVAVYAAAAAGYRAQAYAEFWDRSFFAGGKGGSRFGDFLGITTPDQKRLRRIRAIVAELPAGCGQSVGISSAKFEQWQQAVLEDQASSSTMVQASGSPSAALPLRPPLRVDVDRLRFSRDGKYILAQDESSIYVLSRTPLKELFRFDAEGALPAEFSPDSQRNTFHTPNLHVEEWDIAQRKQSSLHDFDNWWRSGDHCRSERCDCRTRGCHAAEVCVWFAFPGNRRTRGHGGVAGHYGSGAAGEARQ